jgi:hypothetical protein
LGDTDLHALAQAGAFDLGHAVSEESRGHRDSPDRVSVPDFQTVPSLGQREEGVDWNNQNIWPLLCHKSNLHHTAFSAT